MDKSFEDCSFIVTGGSGNLGQVLILKLLELGSTVYNLSSKNCTDINIQRHRNYHEYLLDLNNLNEVKDIAQRIGKVEISGIVNLASRSRRGINLEATSEDIIETYKNVISPTWNVISIFKSNLLKNATIINMGSMWGLVSPDPRVYLDLKNEPAIGLPGAKSAIIQLSKYLAVILAPEMIRVNCVTPGWFPANKGIPRPDYMEEITKRIPQARIGVGEDLLTTFLYLLDFKSNYVTGQNIIVDGGFTLW